MTVNLTWMDPITLPVLTNIRPGSTLVKFIAIGSDDFCNEILGRPLYSVKHSQN